MFVADCVDSFAIKLDGRQAGRLAAAFAQEAQEVAANLGPAHNLDFFDQRAMQQERFFDADARSNFANGDAASVLAFVVGADNHALEHLNALFVTLFDFLVDAHGVAAANIDYLRLLLLVVDFLD